jgi:nucleoside-diphosphate-sugar epimerase
VTPVVVLGCGYTGQVVARRLAARGIRVIATSRHPELLNLPGIDLVRFDTEQSVDVPFVMPNCRIVYSIPTVPQTASVIAAVAPRASRLVYLSTTGVYGATMVVDHTTPASPGNSEGRARVAAETLVLSACANAIVLRAAAIYGPGRGVHVRMAEGRFRLARDGSNYVSRIHVEDLATHVEAALDSEVGGAWPVADELPCPSREIAAFCAELLHIPMPESVDPGLLHQTRQSNRRVDGSAIRRALGISLRYPTYREGIPASLAPVPPFGGNPH